MAKKSAASKGYRKTIKKKPFLSKNEIIALVAIVAAIIVGLILFNTFYHDGYLEAKDVKETDVATFVSAELKNRYQKVADANDLEGFTRTNEHRESSPTSNFTYTPDEPVDGITNITLGGSFLKGENLAVTSVAQLRSFSSNGSFESTEPVTTTVQGHDAVVVSYTMNYYQAPEGEELEEGAETPESNVFSQNISLYVAASETGTVCMHIARNGEDDSHYLSEDEIVDFVTGYADKVFTVYEEPEEAV